MTEDPITFGQVFQLLVSICKDLTGILAFVVLVIKPLRERVLGSKDIREGLKCLLRADMLRIYYKHKDEKKIRQYELENFNEEYEAYRAYKGNSFMVKINKEVQTWEVIS